MFFFPELESAEHSTLDYTHAKALAAAVKQVTKVQQGYSLKSWAAEFTRLEKMLAGDQQRLQTALDWYCQNIAQKFTPMAYSARTFRIKFVQIEACMKLYQQKNPVAEVSELAQYLLTTISRIPWGNAHLEQLPVAIQRTLDERERSLQALQRFLTSLDTSVQHVALSTKAWLKDAELFTLSWFGSKAKRYGQWEQWSGDMVPLTYIHGCEDFINAVLNASRQWEHRTKTGVLILNQMGVQHGS